MAVVLMEGFDNVASNTAVVTKGWGTFSNFTTGRYPAPPGAAASMAGQFSSANSRPSSSKTLPSTYTTLILGYAFNTGNITVPLNGSAGMANLRTGAAATIAAVGVNARNKLQVSNSAPTVIATGTTTINASTWYYVELKIVVNGASGTCELHLDGNTEIASTVGNFGSTAIGIVTFEQVNVGSGSFVQIDDVYAVDTTGGAPQNTFLGPSRVITPLPTGAGTHTQWTPNGAASNYLCVNQAPPDDDTTYVSDATPGDLDSYTFGQADGGASIFAVQTNHYARKDDANTRQIAPLIRQAGTDYIGTTFTEAASYSDFTQLWNQDPTGANWTPATFNADEFGVKEIA